MNKHIAVINTPKSSPDKYFERFAPQIRENKATKKTPIVLINIDYPNGLPSSLVNLGVHLVEGHGNHEVRLKLAKLAEADQIFILAKDEYELGSDSLSFDRCYRMKEHGLA